MSLIGFAALAGLGLLIPVAYRLGHTVGEDGCCPPPRAHIQTTVKAPCPTCRGLVPLRPAQLTLAVCTRPELSHYAFDCPTCSTAVRQPADDEIIALLVSAGVPAEHWHVPAETAETHSGEPISHDDVLDFALGLGSIDIAASALR